MTNHTPSNNWREEVKLEDEGTLMAGFQKARTDAVSAMFDEDGSDRIYHTSKLYARLDDAARNLLSSQKSDIIRRIEGKIQERNCGHDQDGACYAGKYDGDECWASYNKAISDLLSELKEL